MKVKIHEYKIECDSIIELPSESLPIGGRIYDNSFLVFVEEPEPIESCMTSKFRFVAVQTYEEFDNTGLTFIQLITDDDINWPWFLYYERID